MNKNILIIDGGSVKTEEDGVVSGLGIVFGSESEPDQSSQRDFFTADSHIRKSESFTVPVYHEHGLGLSDEEIGEAILTKEEGGWKAVARLDLTNDYAKKVYEAAKTKPYGFSTGALQHLVKRVPKGNNTNFLKKWVVGEISLTERPAERKAVVEYVKSVTADGELVTESAWETEKPMIEIISAFDSENNEIWNLEANKSFEDTVKDLTDPPTSLDIKYVSGTRRYTLFMESEEKGTSAQLEYIEWGSAEELLSYIGTAITNAKFEPKEDLDNDDLEKTVGQLVTKFLEEHSKNELSNDSENKESDELPVDNTDELADLRKQLSDREEELKLANEQVARLEILADAKDTINKNKGK